MEKIFLKFLNPKGASYNAKMKLYNSLKGSDEIFVTQELLKRFSTSRLIQLLVKYVMNEVNHNEQKVKKIAISQEQLEEYFRIIKSKTDDLEKSPDEEG